MEDISTEEFVGILKSGSSDYFLLDVRDQLEFHTYNIGGVNIPLSHIQKLIAEDELEIPQDKTIVIICQRGLRSKTAKTLLIKNGYQKVRNLTGGLLKLRIESRE